MSHHFIPHSKNPERAQSIITDADGSRWASANGDVLSDLFASSPIYRRETPESVTLANGEVIGPKHNNERVVRTFVDAETALEHCETICGWSPELYKPMTAKGKPQAYSRGRKRNKDLERFLERRYTADAAALAASETIFDEVEETLDMETLQGQMVAGPVGGSPNVGAYLQGSPNSMYRRQNMVTTSGVVRIFVDLSSSIGYTGGTLRGRGVSTLALARCIARLRPVELWVGSVGTARQYEPMGGMNGVGKAHMAHTSFMMRISLAPFDTAMASRLLADPFGGRGFSYYGELLSVGQPIGIPQHLAFSRIPFATTVGATDEDICFGAMYSGANGAPSAKLSPADWVKGELHAWLVKTGQATAAMALGA